MKLTIARVLEAAIILAALIVVARPYYLSRTSANTKCYAGAQEQCPTPSFLDEYKDMKSLNDELEAGKQSSAVKRLITISDQLSGMRQRMQGEVPPGFTYSEDKGKFVAVARPTPPVPPVPAVAAPVPVPPVAAVPAKKK